MTVQTSGPNQEESRTLLSALENLLAMDATNVEATLNRAANLVGDVLRAEKVDIFCYDPTIDTLVALGVSDTPLSRKEEARGLAQLPLANHGRAVETYTTQQPHIDGHVDQDQSELIGIRETLGVKSSMITPLYVGEELRGVIMIASTEPERFTDANLRYLQAISGWVGMVLHRAELVEQLTREVTVSARRKVAEELITIFAHDFRTPLTPLHGNLSMLRDRLERAEHDDDLTLLDAALRIVNRMRDLTTDMLDSRRIDEGIFSLTPQPLQLRALVSAVVELLQSAHKPIEIHAPLDMVIDGDELRLRQVLENLIVNAVRFSPDGIPIGVELGRQQRSDGDWATITIRDEGPGIPAELQPVLFDRFSINRQSGSLGLGLYVSRGIIEAHGGTISVQSTYGEGATFTVLLPCLT